jgi:hypothetical protein
LAKKKACLGLRLGRTLEVYLSIHLIEWGWSIY